MIREQLFSIRKHKVIILCIVLMTCIQTISMTGSGTAYAYVYTDGLVGRVSGLGIQNGFITVVSMGLDPIFAIASLAFTRSAGIGIAVFTTVLCVLKVLLTTFRGLNLFCDTTLGKVEEVGGTAMSLGAGFLTSSAVVAYASAAPMVQSSHSAVATFFLTIVAFIVSCLSYLAFFAIRSMIKAFEALAFLFALFPGGYQLMQWLKYGFVVFYTALSILSPAVAAAVGLLILVAAVLLFRMTKRMRRYFQRIYVRPVLRTIFIPQKEFPLVMSPVPKSIGIRFKNILLCQEAFVVNSAGKMPQRERVYIVSDDTGVYICRRLLFKKLDIIPLPLEYLYGEKKARFMNLYVKKHGAERPMLQIVLRRELNKRFDEICGIVKFQIPEASESYMDRLKSVGLFFRG